MCVKDCCPLSHSQVFSRFFPGLPCLKAFSHYLWHSAVHEGQNNLMLASSDQSILFYMFVMSLKVCSKLQTGLLWLSPWIWISPASLSEYFSPFGCFLINGLLARGASLVVLVGLQLCKSSNWLNRAPL